MGGGPAKDDSVTSASTERELAGVMLDMEVSELAHREKAAGMLNKAWLLTVGVNATTSLSISHAGLAMVAHPQSEGRPVMQGIATLYSLVTLAMLGYKTNSNHNALALQHSAAAVRYREWLKKARKAREESGEHVIPAAKMDELLESARNIPCKTTPRLSGMELENAKSECMDRVMAYDDRVMKPTPYAETESLLEWLLMPNNSLVARLEWNKAHENQCIDRLIELYIRKSER